MKTSTDILRTRMKDFGDFIEHDSDLESEILDVMEIYANQFKSTKTFDLKELKDITDEDAIGMARILNNGRHPNDWSINRQNEGAIWIDNQSDDDDNICFSFDGDIDPDGLIYLKAYQYLQSRGYRLPVYFPVQREPDGYVVAEENTFISVETYKSDTGWYSDARPVYFSPLPAVNEKEAVEKKENPGEGSLDFFQMNP